MMRLPKLWKNISRERFIGFFLLFWHLICLLCFIVGTVAVYLTYTTPKKVTIRDNAGTWHFTISHTMDQPKVIKDIAYKGLQLFLRRDFNGIQNLRYFKKIFKDRGLANAILYISKEKEDFNLNQIVQEFSIDSAQFIYHAGYPQVVFIGKLKRYENFRGEAFTKRLKFRIAFVFVRNSALDDFPYYIANMQYLVKNI